ncbi:hypothetical protein ACF061_09500 [Streptomyces sp. NPDC015220]|uniref:hypothetical protein n=1 Tax=Streptomyces sp. NPDC015220 TaxID=3364947 RepID=UPI0036FC702B
MHMNSVPQYLLNEDRQDFARVLDEALRSAPHRPELAAVGQRLNTEQLRTMALGATALITAAAATEYHHYVKVREELRRPVPAVPSYAGEAGAVETDPASPDRSAVMGVTTGAGAGAVVAVLAPVLAGIAAALFLLVGYLLKMLDPAPAFSRTMITAGWVFGVMTAAAIVVAGTGLLLTALRNHPSPEPARYGELGEELGRARDAWHDALLERGILPFLREALADPGSAAPRRPGPAAPGDRIPRLGYDRPGFSSPHDGAPHSRPRFTSPDFTSPDFGGPEHQPE